MRGEQRALVVGAGPVGLLLAGDLATAGVPVTLIEQRNEPMRESRASQLNARSMELLVARGLEAGLSHAVHERTGHVGGVAVDVGSAASPYAGHWKVPQYDVEDLLRGRVRRAGVTVLTGHRLVDLEVSTDAVVAAVSCRCGTRRLRARTVVGCDGTAGPVRGLAGIESKGSPARRELLRADVAGLRIPDRRFTRHPHGVAAAARRPDGVTRVMVHEFGSAPRPATGAPDFREVVSRWERVTGEDIGAGEPHWLDAFDDADRVVESYRRGPILLAGDAAHDHMPVAGQSLNLGLQDAANLGWKLAADLGGWAPTGLLDTYETERRPVAVRVLDHVRAQAGVLLGDRSTDGFRSVLEELVALPEARDVLVGLTSGLDVRYDMGATGPAPLGRRLDDLELVLGADGPATRVSGLLDGRGLLLDLGPRTDVEAARTARAWSDRVRVVRAHPVSAAAHGSVLVRPDGHVAWTDATTLDLDAALRRWFGSPRGDGLVRARCA